VKEIFTTSYKTPEIEDFITSLVRLADPHIVVDIGTQQGKSAVLLGKGMKEGSELYSFDLFEETYSAPPHANTHSNMLAAKENLDFANLKCKWSVRKKAGVEAIEDFEQIDILHIDICNHRDNVIPILDVAINKVKKYILLEGGVKNSWQQKCGFTPFNESLQKYKEVADFCVFKINSNENAITVMSKRETKDV